MRAFVMWTNNASTPPHGHYQVVPEVTEKQALGRGTVRQARVRRFADTKRSRGIQHAGYAAQEAVGANVVEEKNALSPKGKAMRDAQDSFIETLRLPTGLRKLKGAPHCAVNGHYASLVTSPQECDVCQ